MASSLTAIRTASPVAREIVEGRPLQQMQEVALRSTSSLNAFPLQPGMIISITSTGGTNETVNHGLGRIPRGWLVVDMDAPNIINRFSWDEGQITLSVWAPGSAKIWVF